MSGYQYDPSGNSQTPQEYLWYSTLTEAYPIQDNNNGGDPLDINPQPAQTHPSPGYYYPPGPFEGLPMNYYHQDPVGNAMFQIPESSQSWMQYTQQTPSDGSSYGYAINPAFNNQMVPSPTPNFPSNPAYSNPLQQYPVESPRQVQGYRGTPEFHCDICPAKFPRKTDLARHRRSVHTQETPYVCKGCGSGFVRSDARGRHWKDEVTCMELHKFREENEK